MSKHVVFFAIFRSADSHLPTFVDPDLPNKIQQVQALRFLFDRILMCFLLNVIVFSNLPLWFAPVSHCGDLVQ